MGVITRGRARARERMTTLAPQALPPTRGWAAEAAPGISAGAGHDLADVSVSPPEAAAEPIQRKPVKPVAERKAAREARRLKRTLRRTKKRAMNRLNIQQARRQRPRRPRPW